MTRRRAKRLRATRLARPEPMSREEVLAMIDRARAQGRARREANAAKPRPLKTRRKTGDEYMCTACGQVGHVARWGECSAAYVGARLVMEQGLSHRQAAKKAGTARQNITRRLKHEEAIAARAAAKEMSDVEATGRDPGNRRPAGGPG